MITYDFFANQKDNQFYPICETDIEEVEGMLGLKLSLELRKFLLEVDYGFLRGSEYNVNRIIGPSSIRDVRLKVNGFRFYPDIELYENLVKEKLIFFEANESALLLIEISEEQHNTIHYDNIKVANSLE